MTLFNDELADLRVRHPAWILLRADNAPLILNFLRRVFVDRNAGHLPASELARELDEELDALNLEWVRAPIPSRLAPTSTIGPTQNGAGYGCSIPANVRRASLRTFAGGRKGPSVGGRPACSGVRGH
jgi:hypothetical protein